jgi:ribonuclease P protein component
LVINSKKTSLTNRKFGKNERLCSKKIIGNLFLSGTVVKKFPFKLIYGCDNSGRTPVKVLVSVPKKIHRRATQRNFIRRKIREAYRLKKHVLYEVAEMGRGTLNIIIIYTASNVYTYAEIEKKIEKILVELVEKLKENSNFSAGDAD